MTTSPKPTDRPNENCMRCGKKKAKAARIRRCCYGCMGYCSRFDCVLCSPKPTDRVEALAPTE